MLVTVILVISPLKRIKAHDSIQELSINLLMIYDKCDMIKKLFEYTWRLLW